MPLVNDFKSGDGYYTTKQLVNFYDSANTNPLVVSEQIKNGDGIFASLGSLIAPAVNFATANKDLIQAGAQTAASLTQAGKNVNDTIISSRKFKSELDVLKKLKSQIGHMKQEKEPSSSLSKEQTTAIKEGLKSMTGKGFRIY